MMLTWMYITNDPTLARIAVDAGVERIFVDWEIHGKQERQGHFDTVISYHSYDDAVKIRDEVPDAELLIRINPYHEGTAVEVEQALVAGANLIMLPMFHAIEEVETLCNLVDDRAGVVPLLETPESMKIVQEIVALKGIHEVYVGLNDLHFALELNFMFEPLTMGMLDEAAQCTKQAGLRFGFGGVARADEGAVSGAMVLGEHLRLHSDSVILSRTFYRPDEEKEDVRTVFSRELKRLREEEVRLSCRDSEEELLDHEKFCEAVAEVARARKAKHV